MMKNFLPLLALLIFAAGCTAFGRSGTASGNGDHYNRKMSDTWTAVDGLGRTVRDDGRYPSLRENRTVGIFYFTWMGAHGYDNHIPPLSDEGVHPVLPTDTQSPYDISEMLRRNPDDPQYGPVSAFHHWGEPYFGYYVSNDEWVIRKHGQMLADAGIDVMIIDATNALIYLPQVLTICRVFTEMRSRGSDTPQLAFILNSKSETTLPHLYESFYKKNLYPELWFRWKGKPLLLCPPEGVTLEIDEFFSVRHSWFASSWDWFEDGKDKWPWADFYPQKAGWHESPDIPEAVAVCAATHPTSNIGRSYHNGKQPSPDEVRSAEGAHFAEQFEYALEIDPEFIFITGWNEWVAMRFVDGAAGYMLDKKISKGDTYFVDQYNEEFSRDIEPMKGGFGDAFYYQMVDFIRRYKGVEALPAAGPVKSMAVDGDATKWKKVRSVYYDDTGDTAPRDHHGWGRVGQYTDNSGRNDITETRVACDGENLYFAVWTDGGLTPYTDPMWMRLFISVDGDADGWEGFGWMLNDSFEGPGRSVLKRSDGGWNWNASGTVPVAVKDNFMELAVPLSSLGISGNRFAVEFKWIDNAVAEGDIQECMDQGDSAPNSRFRYRYEYKN